MGNIRVPGLAAWWPFGKTQRPRPKAVQDGRTGCAAINDLPISRRMRFNPTPEMNDSQKLSTQQGLVAFFDILGFRKMLQANTIIESLDIINKVMLRELEQAESTFGGLVKTFVISDSILITLPIAKKAPVLPWFCSRIMFGLLLEGLPVRGAIAAGEFYVQQEPNKIIFVGQPIIDAYELAASMEIAACAVVPSSESKILGHSRANFERYKTPLKNRTSCDLYLLKYEIENCPFSREEIIKSFEAHKKHLDPDSYSKFNNTIEFLNQCGDLKPL
jgi:hypothetical protein